MAESTTSTRPAVTLVIPGRNCAATIRPCLDAAIAIARQPNTPLAEIIFVNDNSDDETPAIVRTYSDVRMLDGPGRGPAIARNIGWRAAQHPLIWFIDSDCVARPDALDRLLPHLDDPDVAGVSGSYDIENDQARLARLIHEEIIERHRRMNAEVNFLASFNVLYRANVLQQVGGFDERYTVPAAEDAHLSFAVQQAGYRLRFELSSRVGHYHPTQLRRYLRTQARHGYWRVLLHLEHRGHAGGDSYSSWLDHAQPILAVGLMGALLLALIAVLAPLPQPATLIVALLPAALLVLLMAATVPMTWRLVRRIGRLEMLLYAPLSAVRAVWRGIGLAGGTVQYGLRGRHRPDSAHSVQT